MHLSIIILNINGLNVNGLRLCGKSRNWKIGLGQVIFQFPIRYLSRDLQMICISESYMLGEVLDRNTSGYYNHKEDI